MERTLHSVRNQSNQTGLTHSRGWMMIVLKSCLILLCLSFFSYYSLGQVKSDNITDDLSIPKMVSFDDLQVLRGKLERELENYRLKHKDEDAAIAGAELVKTEISSFGSIVNAYIPEVETRCPNFPSKHFCLINEVSGWVAAFPIEAQILKEIYEKLIEELNSKSK